MQFRSKTDGRTIIFKSPGSITGAGRYAISPDGRWVVTGFNFGQFDAPQVWDARTGELVKTLKADGSVVAFSPDGKWLGLGGVDRCSVWSTGDWVKKSEYPREEASLAYGALAFTAEGSWLAFAATLQIVELRDTVTGQKVADLIPPARQTVNSIRVSSDGGTLVTATASDMVEAWNIGSLRKDLAGMNLGWGTDAVAADSIPDLAAGNWPVTLAASLGGFALAVGFTLLALRRHRAAIERFVLAEARAAQRNRELGMAKVELMHSQKMQALGTLAAGIAHDFNNLLSVIRMSGKLIGHRAVGDADIQENVSDIEQAVLQGKNVVGSMLGYARLEGGEGTPTEVTEVVENVVSLLSEEFLSGIALTLELDREVPSVDTGRGRLEQILLNLLVNASEAMNGEGKLKIVVHTVSSLPKRNYVLRPAAASQFVELTVIDSGPGIAADIQNRVFEPFFTTKRSGSKAGTGLGLSLVYSIAKQSELGLAVESQPGNGTSFSLAIPVSPPPAPVRQTHSAETEGTDYSEGEDERGTGTYGVDTHS